MIEYKTDTKVYQESSWKGRFINDLIGDLNYQKYLELGVANAESWNQVNCKYKVGVDNTNDEIWHIDDIICLTTDDYFKTIDSSEKFDIIYIDACHEKTQVKKDFYNSWKHLNSNGIILIHDVNPPTKEGTSLSAHGDCFELWIEMVNRYPKSTAVYNAAKGTAMFNNIDTLGIWFKHDEIIDENDVKVQKGTFNDNTYEYFSENHFLYNENIALNYLEIINRIKTK